MGSNIDKLRRKAQECWEEAFNDGPYSNFLQGEYLVNKSGEPWGNILKDKNLLKKKIKIEDLTKDQSTSFIRTWWAAGRCTSFATRIVRQLQEYSSASFDFKFYDLNGHRVARCMKTGILIDSSSAVGVLVLNDGDDWTTIAGDTRDRQWKWRAGMSKFDGGQGLKESGNALSVQQSMSQCLIEISERFEPLCLFRSFAHGRAHFHGMIKWVPSKKQLVLIKKLGERDNITIQFDKSGTAATEAQCRGAVTDFIARYGGPEGEKQWRFGQPDHRAMDIHEKIWAAAIQAWGNPRLA
ncbi:hypothetical protein ANOM_002666 [Aspergillus nomiae NRRL 13137]|uniref:Uncharacterized protein n=1 Tax=Aspergillus nomiae NRRL (strain ATCC 15546 / NRRL 13137 / CBS 260.88 / M93) TaxID=1509407 RepID=A0A0L1JC72_ASPN3|nr:uncharacterized protein ANOM_002666 [Aspergillus nomiae NRRL 13137]KNG89325.1 hypothetical protein ANOM_002666 [Aspergillus nomiae NRRL 13137]